MVAATLRADVYVSGRNWPRGAEDSGLADELVQALANDDEVESIDLLRRVFVTVDGSRIAFAGVDIDTTGEDARFPLIGADAASTMAQVKDGGAILLAEPLAHRLKLQAGEQLRVPLSSGTHLFPVAGTYYDYSSASGSAIMSLETMQRVFGPAEVNSLGLHLKPGVDPDAHADLLRESVDGLTGE